MKYELRITGMHCTSCAQSVEQYLHSEPGVTDATVSYETERGTVTARPDVEIEQLVAAIERMGYDAALLDAE